MTHKDWSILSKKPLFKNKWVDLEEWKIQVDESHVGEYSIEHARDVAVVFPITTDNTIIMLKEYYIAHQQYVYSLPAGVVDVDPLTTAHHELREETGYAAGEIIYIGSSFLAKYKTGQVHYYLAKDVQRVGEPMLEPSEDIDVMPVSLSAYLAHLRACEIQDQAEVACSYLALDRLGFLLS